MNRIVKYFTVENKEEHVTVVLSNIAESSILLTLHNC